MTVKTYEELLDVSDPADTPTPTPVQQRVIDAYHSVLGRDPDPGGFASWTDNLEHGKFGVTSENLNQLMAASGAAELEQRDNAAAQKATDERAVDTQTLFEDAPSIVPEAPTPQPYTPPVYPTAPFSPGQSGILRDTTTGRLVQSGAALAPGASIAPTGDPVEDQIRLQYASLYGREPDPEGLDFWKNRVNTGTLALSDLGGAIQTAGANFEMVQQPPQQAGLLPSIAALNTGGAATQGILQQGTDQAVGTLSPYADIGQQALQEQAAISGALGPEEQARAQAAFTESPGQAFLRARQEQALLRNQSAIGGLGGGQVRTALQEQAAGIAGSQQQQYINNLSALSGLGLSATTGQAGFQQQRGIAGAGFESNRSLQEAQARLQAGRDIAQTRLALGQAQAGLQSGLGTQLAGLQAGTVADLTGVIGGGATNLSNINTAQGITLANLAAGQGSQQANLAQQLGATNAAGLLGEGQAWQTGLGGVANMAGRYMPYNQPVAQPLVIT